MEQAATFALKKLMPRVWRGPCRLATPAALVATCVAFVVTQSWIAWVLGAKLSADVLQLQTSFHVDSFVDVIRDWSDDEHARFVKHFAVDFALHPLFCTLLLISWLFNEVRLRAIERHAHSAPRLQSCCSATFGCCGCDALYDSGCALMGWVLLIVAGGGADVVENALHLGLTQRIPGLTAPTTPIVAAASAFACAKWAIALGSVAALTAAFLERRCCRLRAKQD